MDSACHQIYQMTRRWQNIWNDKESGILRECERSYKEKKRKVNKRGRVKISFAYIIVQMLTIQKYKAQKDKINDCVSETRNIIKLNAEARPKLQHNNTPFPFE